MSCLRKAEQREELQVEQVDLIWARDFWGMRDIKNKVNFTKSHRLSITKNHMEVTTVRTPAWRFEHCSEKPWRLASTLNPTNRKCSETEVLTSTSELGAVWAVIQSTQCTLKEVALSYKALNPPPRRISGWLPKCNEDQLRLRSPDSSNMGEIFLGCKHMLHIKMAYASQEHSWGGGREQPRKDAARLGSSPQRLHSPPDGTVCSRRVPVNTPPRRASREGSAIWSSRFPLLSLPPSPRALLTPGTQGACSCPATPHCPSRMTHVQRGQSQASAGPVGSQKGRVVFYIPNVCHPLSKGGLKWDLFFKGIQATNSLELVMQIKLPRFGKYRLTVQCWRRK